MVFSVLYQIRRRPEPFGAIRTCVWSYGFYIQVVGLAAVYD